MEYGLGSGQAEPIVFSHPSEEQPEHMGLKGSQSLYPKVPAF